MSPLIRCGRDLSAAVLFEGRQGRRGALDNAEPSQVRALKLVAQRLVEREDEKLDALCERLHKAAEARDEFAASPDAGRIEPGHRSSARSIRGVDR